MKLLLCKDCYDVFKLDYEMRQCKCGKVKGRYLDGRMAEVSKDGVSIALGNGSVELAYGQMLGHRDGTGDKAPREDYYKPGQGKIEYAWVRPNSGPGNPHTRIIEEADDAETISR